ncbi:MAG: hypothetical protein PHN75_10590, partial [Syntrophales bacterium]|nr:hypothetical protein [Syntrophales bacterium]
PTAPLASCRIEAAGAGAVDNRNPQGLYLRKPKTCPNKPSHFSGLEGGDESVRHPLCRSIYLPRIE